MLYTNLSFRQGRNSVQVAGQVSHSRVRRIPHKIPTQVCWSLSSQAPEIPNQGAYASKDTTPLNRQNTSQSSSRDTIRIYVHSTPDAAFAVCPGASPGLHPRRLRRISLFRRVSSKTRCTHNQDLVRSSHARHLQGRLAGDLAENPSREQRLLRDGCRQRDLLRQFPVGDGL